MLQRSFERYRRYRHALRVQADVVARTVRLIFQACPRYTVAWLILLLVQGIAPVIIVQLTKITVDHVVEYIEADDGSLVTAVVPVLLLVLMVVTEQITGQVKTWVNVVQTEQIKDYIKSLIHQKAISLDLYFFEEAESYDKLHRANVDAHSRPMMLLQGFGSLLQSGVTLVGMAVLLVSYAVWLLPLLIITAVPAGWIVVKYANRLNAWRLANTHNERRSIYYSFLLADRESAGEIRIFDLGGYYSHAYDDLRRNLRHERIKIERDRMFANISAMLFGLVTTGLVMVWMISRVIAGAATWGDLAAFYQIFQQSQRLVRNFLNQSGNMYQSSLFILNLFEFLDLQPRLVDAPSRPMLDMPLKHSIEFKNVTFSYPGTSRAALQGFNWQIPAGKIVALVGENGEGKTTLMKLLCRFYDPDEGQVLLDGIDIRDLPLAALHRQITTLFQVPWRFQETVRDNIRAGDRAANPSDDDIQAAARVAGADDFIRRLPKDYDTQLGKWFGGDELSGGEWQRLALARAFVRQGSIVILDEPTSAMDSWAELDWLERFRRVAVGCTSILITHRFTTAMQADLIYVMKDNQIIEHGTHDELVALDGHYATSWKKQMQEELSPAPGGQPTAPRLTGDPHHSAAPSDVGHSRSR